VTQLHPIANATMGDAPKRREDDRFLTGRGAYLDDLSFDRLSHAVFVRSPHPHARITGLDCAESRRAPGVLAVLTAAEAEADGLRPIRPVAEVNTRTGEPFSFIPQPLLAKDKVRFAGEAVAMVIAETKAQAFDAAELVEVEYEALPAISSSAEALAPGAVEIAEGVSGNICLDWHVGDAEAMAAILDRAAHVVELALDNHRIVTNPMEPRGVVGTWDDDAGRYVVHVSSQNLHSNRDHTARALGVEPADVRFIAPDVGGGFGAKNFVYAELALLAWAGRRVGRPVKWIATRSEVFLTDHQSRDLYAKASLALDTDGRFLGMRVDSVANLGGYMIGSSGGVQTYQYAHLPGTVYDIPTIELQIRAVLTNTTPIGVTRAPGFAEANHIMERLIDVVARQCGFDRFELRRMNMYRSDAMPFTNAMGESVDSGAFAETMDAALAQADQAGFAARRTQSEAQGYLRGFGLAYHIKGTGGSPHENVEICFEKDGTVSLITGTQTIGQGHETTFPQLVAERLGVENALIHLRQGDTDLIPTGGGHGSSRATYMAGTAIWRASDEIIAKGTAEAAAALEAAEDDISFSDGHFTVSGTDRSISLLQVAVLAREAGRSLDTYHHWTRKDLTFPNGAHVVEVEIDRESGKLRLDRYTAIDDYGVQVNPMVVAGQAHGAIAQGIGQGMLEEVIHDPNSGQPLTGSFMDYAMPRADDLPSYDLGFNATRCTTNPLGVKGCGEAGAIAAPSAICNAIADALAPFGVVHIDGSATSERLWRAMQGAKA
jgi:carbon-monoxide dehydrogenase large subunit